MSDQLNNIRAAYRVLENRVVSALRTQLGDQLRLSSHLVHMRILTAVPQVDHPHFYIAP